MTKPPLTFIAPRNRRAAALFLLFAPIAIAGLLGSLFTGQPQHTSWFFAGVLLLFAAGLAAELRNRSRTVILLPDQGFVEVLDRTILFTRRSRRYALPQFRAVVSYLTSVGIPPVNRAELMLANGREGLLLVSASPVWVRRGFLKMAGYEEHPAVQAAREAAASALCLEDQGFIGYRSIAHQIAPHAA